MLTAIKELLRDSHGLKGREIANRIGKDKKLVNSFLHAHPNDFKQDINYRWLLSLPPEIRIEFEANRWVDCSSFEHSLLESGSPLDSDSNSVVFVIPEKCKILLEAAARFLALCNQLAHEEKLVTIDFNDCTSTLRYFDRIGFIEHLDSSVNVLPKRPTVSRALIYKGNSEAVVEFGTVHPRNADKELINQLTNRFVQQSSRHYEAAAFTVFSELIGNVSEHSETPLYGFAALQRYGGRKRHIQTVISDSGLGIVATLKPSLREHYPSLYKLLGNENFDVELVTAVLTKGDISRFGSGRGLGFKSSREQAIKFDARLSVRQEHFSLDFIYDKGEVVNIDMRTKLPTIHGTHLCFDFFVD